MAWEFLKDKIGVREHTQTVIEESAVIKQTDLKLLKVLAYKGLTDLDLDKGVQDLCSRILESDDEA